MQLGVSARTAQPKEFDTWHSRQAASRIIAKFIITVEQCKLVNGQLCIRDGLVTHAVIV